jgi:hypothetical protein
MIRVSKWRDGEPFFSEKCPGAVGSKPHEFQTPKHGKQFDRNECFFGLSAFEVPFPKAFMKCTEKWWEILESNQ